MFSIFLRFSSINIFHRQRRLAYLTAIAMVLLIPAAAMASSQVTLAFSAVTNAEGYKIYSRQEGSVYQYDNPVWTGSDTTCTISNLTDDTTYYFVAKSYSGTQHSADSNEVRHRTPASVTYTITANTGANGSLQPSGNISVPQGGSQTFNIQADPGYQIDQVKVDGVSIGAMSSYNFSSISANHSISVSFADNPTAGLILPDEEKFWIEAEDGNIDWPMIIADDPEASDGGYIYAPAGSVALVTNPTDSTGRSDHTFEVASAGEYSVWGRVIANNADGDSFHVAMDDEDYTVWSVAQTPTDVWTWQVIGDYHLQAGPHKLIVATRQAGTRIDRILVTNALDYVPSDATFIPKDDWQLVSVDSEELVGEDGAAVNAFDGNPDTIWHTEWRYSTPTHPHELVIDLGRTYQLDGFTILPRQNGINGRIIDYEFYVSNKPDQWYDPAAQGTFTDNLDEKSVTFSPTEGRYIKLVALSSTNNGPWTSLAEISVTGMATTDCAMLPKSDWQLVSVDSEELVGEDGAAINAFDGNPDTIWHTEWKYADPAHPHELVIDLGRTYQLDGFTILPRQNGTNGRIIDYEFFVSNYPDQWYDPVVKGSFANDADEKSVTFNSTVGRYIKLVALSSTDNAPWTSLAEIGVTGMATTDYATLPKSDWQLVSVDSEELVGEDGAAINAFDGNPDTIWHTEWRYTSPTHPHELVIDLGRTYQLDGFTMLPRQNGTNGRIIDYEFYVGNHPDQWYDPVAKGSFTDNSDEKSVTFNPTVGRYIKLVALSSTDNAPWTSLAEIGVTGMATTDYTTLPKSDWQLVSVDSEELVGEDGAAINAFDSNPDTIWHTEWRYADPTHPHELVIDLGRTYQLGGFTILPRQNGINGRIIDYEFYASNHPDQWNPPVTKGSFADNPDEKSVTFNPTVGRYIKLVALSSANNAPWTSLAEISVTGMELLW
ncbi:MAG: discoidin domain-containing protein [Desulfobacteraceae bacterium]|jgi:hypothetical protein